MLQVVSLNIGGYANSSSSPTSASRFAHDITESLQIDTNESTIIALQEVVQLWRDQHVLDLGDLISKELGTHYRTFWSSKKDSKIHSHYKAWSKPVFEGTTRATEGNSIVTNLKTVPWPWPSATAPYPGPITVESIATSIGRATLFSTGDRDTEPRNLLVASLNAPFGSIYFMTTHLSTFRGEDRKNRQHPVSRLATEARVFEVNQILSVVRELRAAEAMYDQPVRPIILAADFNAEPQAPEMQLLQTQFVLLKPRTDGGYAEDWTHIGHRVHIDHILVSDPAKAIAETVCWIPNATPRDRLDHLPVIAILR